MAIQMATNRPQSILPQLSNIKSEMRERLSVSWYWFVATGIVTRHTQCGGLTLWNSRRFGPGGLTARASTAPSSVSQRQKFCNAPDGPGRSVVLTHTSLFFRVQGWIVKMLTPPSQSWRSTNFRALVVVPTCCLLQILHWVLQSDKGSAAR